MPAMPTMVSHAVQVRSVCDTREAEEVLHDPEAGVVQVRQEQRAAAHRDDDQRDLVGGQLRVLRQHRHQQPRRRRDRDRRRAGRDADERRQQPAVEQRRQVHRLGAAADRLGDARVAQHPREAAAAADDQQRHPHRGDALLGELQDLRRACSRSACPSDHDANSTATSSAITGWPMNVAVVSSRLPGRQRQLGQRRQQHQHDRQQDREQRQPEAGRAQAGRQRADLVR